MESFELFADRLESWKQRFVFDFKKRWWWIVVLGPVSGFVWALIMDRVIGRTNRYIDEHVSLASIKPVFLYVWSSPLLHPVVVGIGVFLLTILVLVVHAYIETRKPQKKPIIELIPSTGPSDKMLLEVKNLESEQEFRAQYRVSARRNDPNLLRTGTFDLKWDRTGTSRVSLARGESCNLIIARAREEHGMEVMELLGLSDDDPVEWSPWNQGQKDKLPEYDLEITIFGDRAEAPYSERFTLRPGKHSALEMFSTRPEPKVGS
jgi:hypothetical protein